MAFYNDDPYQQGDPYGFEGAYSPEPDPDPYGGAPPQPAPGGGSGGGSGPGGGTPAPNLDFWKAPSGFNQFDSYDGPSGFYAIPDAPQYTPYVVPKAPTFEAPTLEQAQSEPGYQFRSLEGQKALERSAAARGLLRTGGTLKDISDYGQNFAQQEYGNVFNRRLQGYDKALQAYGAQTGMEQKQSLEGYNNALRAYGTQTGFERDRALAQARNMLDAWSTRFNAQRRAMELLASIGSNIYMNEQNDPRGEPIP